MESYYGNTPKNSIYKVGIYGARKYGVWSNLYQKSWKMCQQIFKEVTAPQNNPIPSGSLITITFRCNGTIQFCGFELQSIETKAYQTCRRQKTGIFDY